MEKENAVNNRKGKIAFIMVVLLLTSMAFAAGCIEQNPVRSQDDVSRIVTNISTNVENAGSTLEGIDRSLGGQP